ncbi:MAG TPA: 3D-(3,5/4)-trihydroxycyclohexane-1,2-dione acylhydrolase (decyclizing) [Dongiaceae bacterium]
MPKMTMAQALARYMAAQWTIIDGEEKSLFAGVFAIFGHGNVAGFGQALAEIGNTLPTYRAHNEQAMAHAAIAFAKASNRRRMMACTSSIGPGATNMVTAAALAHVDRLPLLLLPGDIFANRRPDPVLQQIENFSDPTISANDCFKPVSRYWDRITRPEQLLASLPQAMRVLTDPADCGPVVLSLPQDVQAEAGEYPESFFERRIHHPRRPGPDDRELSQALAALRKAKAPFIIAGGGVHYSEAAATLADFAERHGMPVGETQAGKGALPWTHALNMGSIGVTGSAASNELVRKADVILAIGTRLQDFTTGSQALWSADAKLIQLNVAAFDAGKQNALSLVADAKAGLAAIDKALGDWHAPAAWTKRASAARDSWQAVIDKVTAPPKGNALASDAQVLGAVNRKAGPSDIMVCAAGGLPGELHKLWRTVDSRGYHLEYGFSCMGYEIAGGLGVKMAFPDRRVVVMVGDGSYLMMNSELATSVMMGLKLDVVLLNNRGYGCINRLQQSVGDKPFNNLLPDNAPEIDFAAHARSLGAEAETVGSIAELERAFDRAKKSSRSHVIVIETDPAISTREGGAWWDVPVAETAKREQVRKARVGYVEATTRRDDR